jgi:hypothetical protein
MGGLVTERHFAEAEAAFPGIEAFYRQLEAKPRTFLDLMRLYLLRVGQRLAEADDGDCRSAVTSRP